MCLLYGDGGIGILLASGAHFKGRSYVARFFVFLSLKLLSDNTNVVWGCVWGALCVNKELFHYSEEQCANISK